MLQPTALTLEQTAPETDNVTPISVKARLAKRLADVICIPSNQITPQERHMAGDQNHSLTLILSVLRSQHSQSIMKLLLGAALSLTVSLTRLFSLWMKRLSSGY